MLCPEVWNFKAPASDFKIEKSDKPFDSCSKTINNFYFNHLISLTVPDALNIPKVLSDILIDDCDYYKVCKLDVSEFVNATFVNSFVKSGALTLLSINTKIDCDNCVVITPSKKLILSLTKESYQASGLEGAVSHFCTNTKYKYIVKLDLSILTATTKNFERTKNCLKTLGLFDVILIWEPAESKICPSSIAKYFDGLEYEVKVCSPKYEPTIRYSVKTPLIDFENCDRDDCAEYVEWLGMLGLAVDIEKGSPTDFLNTYEMPVPNINLGQVRILTWSGFFSSKKLELFFKELMKYQEENEKSWLSLYVQGFSDSAVNWVEREHHYYSNGDNSYTIFLSSSNSIICSNMSTYKRYNKKQKSKFRKK